MKTTKFTYVAPEMIPFFNGMDEEIQAINEMTAKVACELYNVDSKEEAIEIVTDYWMTEKAN